MSNLKKYFWSGFAITLPVVLTIYLFIIIFKISDGILNPIFKRILGIYIPGLGIIASILIIFIIGFLATHFFNKQIFRFLENLFVNIPFVKNIYPSAKQLSRMIFSGDSKLSFKKVVLVEYPRQGIWSLGFVTNEATLEVKTRTGKEDLINILIPTTPTPLSGFMIIMPQNDVVFLDMTIEDALKMIISGGIILPNQK